MIHVGEHSAPPIRPRCRGTTPSIPWAQRSAVAPHLRRLRTISARITPWPIRVEAHRGWNQEGHSAAPTQMPVRRVLGVQKRPLSRLFPDRRRRSILDHGDAFEYGRRSAPAPSACTRPTSPLPAARDDDVDMLGHAQQHLDRRPVHGFGTSCHRVLGQARRGQPLAQAVDEEARGLINSSDPPRRITGIARFQAPARPHPARGHVGTAFRRSRRRTPRGVRNPLDMLGRSACPTPAMTAPHRIVPLRRDRAQARG